MYSNSATKTALLVCLAGGVAVAVGCQREQQLPKSIPVEQHNARPAPILLAQLPGPVVEQVKRQLAADPLLHGASISVIGTTGYLRLHGFVSSGAQRQRAIAIAQTVLGDAPVEARLIRRGRSGVADGPLPDQLFLL